MWIKGNQPFSPALKPHITLAASHLFFYIGSADKLAFPQLDVNGELMDGIKTSPVSVYLEMMVFYPYFLPRILRIFERVIHISYKLSTDFGELSTD